MNRRTPGDGPEPKPEIDLFGDQRDEPPSRAPSLIAMYIALAIALAAAIGLAVLIVLPFYRRIGH